MPVPPLSRWRATLESGWLAGIFSNFFSFMSWYFSTMTITVNSIDRGITRFAHSPTDRPWLLSIYWILLDSRSSPPSSQLFSWSGDHPIYNWHCRLVTRVSWSSPPSSQKKANYMVDREITQIHNLPDRPTDNPLVEFWLGHLNYLN